MRYWWVNQNQTFRQEFEGGYLWSPKVKANGALNPFYEFMREVSPGDVIFCFADTWIKAIGIARSHAYESPKPIEFGAAGAYWDVVGWRIDVQFTKLNAAIRPVDYIGKIQPYLPDRYAPLQFSGAGLQGVYLTELKERLAALLIDLIGSEARGVVQIAGRVGGSSDGGRSGLVAWEEHQLSLVQASGDLEETQRQAIVMARRGQGLFRERVAAIEKRCRVTGVDRREYLRASHSKPWRDATNAERLDGENGLMLTPDVDLLFDRGLISFDDNGDVLVSPVADMLAFDRMGLSASMLKNVGAFSIGQRTYLQFHRESVFLRARVREREAANGK